MIPYFAEPVLQAGPFRIHAFSLLLVGAVLLGLFIVGKRAQRSGINRELMLLTCFWAIVCGLAGAHVAKVAMDFTPRFFANPLIVFNPDGGIRSLGAFLGGLLGAIGYCRLRRVPAFEVFRMLDVIAYALSFAWAVGRLGCALAHDHRGLPTSSWIGVQFPEGTRYDLGLIEFLFLAGMSAVFYWLDHRGPMAPGFYFGAYGVVYGGFRIWLDTLHLQPMRFYGGVTGVLIGLAGWALMKHYSRTSVILRAGDTPSLQDCSAANRTSNL